MGHQITQTRRRGVAPWVIITVVVIVLVAAATTVFLISVNKRSTVGDCTSRTVLAVTASTGAARAVSAAATAYNATNPVARSSCVTISVSTRNGTDTAKALSGGWKGQATPAPALWVADSAADVAALDAGHPEMTAGSSKTPLATSPVVLAVRSVDAVAAGSLTWKALPAAVGSLALSDGVKLSVVVPDPRKNQASQDALQSIVAAVSATSPITAASIVAARVELSALAAAQPSGAPSTTKDALVVLAGSAPSFTAVPVTEADLAAFNTSAGSAALTAVYPGGPTAIEQIMPIPLTASWVDETQSDAAAGFGSYLLGAEGQKVFGDNGFRVAGSAPTAVRGINFKAAITALPDASAAVRSALVDAFTPPAGTTTSPTS